MSMSHPGRPEIPQNDPGETANARHYPAPLFREKLSRFVNHDISRHPLLQALLLYSAA